MQKTEQTLLEQMKITEFEIDNRLQLFGITEEDIKALGALEHSILEVVDNVVARFYEMQTGIAEIAVVIGDADTLVRLRNAQRHYIAGLFGGIYDIEYVNNRLRIGLVHKRIGVPPKLYLSAVQALKKLLIESILTMDMDDDDKIFTVAALEKIMSFDVSLVFDTYIRSLVSEIELSKAKTEEYANILEQKISERTAQLEEMSRTDPLTGLLNTRHFTTVLKQTLRSAQRRAEIVTVAYLDVNNFKEINDTKGHQHGDDVLKAIAAAIKSVAREDDMCFRYGGDEFCIVMSACTVEQAVDIYKTRLHQKIKAYDENLSISLGFAETGPDEYLDPETLIKQADSKMYADKKKTKEKAKKSKK